MKAIIEGTIVRFAMFGDGVEFSVRVSQTLIEKEVFTLGTVVNCVVQPPKLSMSDCIIKEGHVIPVPKEPVEPLKTALCLSVRDKVTIEMEKNEKGSWEVVTIEQKPERGQNVDEFLRDVEEIIEDRRRKTK